MDRVERSIWLAASVSYSNIHYCSVTSAALPSVFRTFTNPIGPSPSPSTRIRFNWFTTTFEVESVVDHKREMRH